MQIQTRNSSRPSHHPFPRNPVQTNRPPPAESQNKGLPNTEWPRTLGQLLNATRGQAAEQARLQLQKEEEIKRQMRIWAAQYDREHGR